jgi:hypothetical protein
MNDWRDGSFDDVAAGAVRRAWSRIFMTAIWRASVERFSLGFFMAVSFSGAVVGESPV